MSDTYRPSAGYGGAGRARESDRYSRDPRYDDRQRCADPYQPVGRDGYTFRGAADRQPERYRPQDQFSFHANGPPAPRFPPFEHYPPPQRSYRRPDERERRHDGPRAIDVARQRHAQPQRGRGGFRGRAAHKRDILRVSGRETTPEQLEGMNMDGQIRFFDVESISSGNELGEVIDLTRDSDDEAKAPCKRTKLDGPAESAVPKWSNPDPYTVLPPPETLGALKKDIVQVIRKAKTDAVSKSNGKNAVQENVDFISFNSDDDMDNGHVSDDSESMEVDYTEHSVHDTADDSSGFSHRNDLHAKIPSAQMQAPSSRAVNQSLRTIRTDVATAGPPAPPAGFVMPTDEELKAQYASEGKGTKRKRRDGYSKSKGDIVDEWYANDTDPTPWCTVDHSQTSSPALRLHKEICDFYTFVRPHEYEEAVRRDLIGRIQRAIRTSTAKGAGSVTIHCFGSFAAGLYLPTADMDLVAVSQGYMDRGRKLFCQSGTQMHKIKSHFEWRNVAPAEGVAVVSRAKVPIIKFPDKMTGIKVDISFENNSGIVANETFQQWKVQYPAMPVIVVLVKQLLAMRGLNEVFTGGIGGFTTICLVVSMMQLMPELQSDSSNQSPQYGDLLMEFLDLYGNRFDIRSTGIRMDPPGYFNKISDPAPKQNANRLTIVDPNNSLNDISGGSHEIDTVLDCFRHAHAALQRRLAQINAGQNVGDSILGCVWGGNYTSFIHQRKKLSMLHRGYAVSPPPPPPPKPIKNSHVNGEVKAKKQAPTNFRKQAQPFVSGADNDGQFYYLTKKPDSQAKCLPPSSMTRSQVASDHTLPPKPAAQAHALPSKPMTQNHLASDQNGSMKIIKGNLPKQLTKAEKNERLNESRRKRARVWKTMFPGIQGVPDVMTHGNMLKLNKQHGIFISVEQRKALTDS